MKEFEITVLINNSKEEVEKIIRPLKKDHETLILDTYLVKRELDITRMDDLEVLDNTVLIRNINGKIYLNKKIKVYDKSGNTIKRSTYYMDVNSYNEAFEFMSAIGYVKLFDIEDNLVEYKNNNIEFAIQYVKDIGIMIEVEANENQLNNIEEFKIDCIKNLKQLGFKFNENLLDVKKAQLMLNKIR